jgi:hypothetical protein
LNPRVPARPLWASGRGNGFILRDASLRDAPQGEVFFLDEVLDPHGEARAFARLEP